MAITQLKASTFDIRDSLGYHLAMTRLDWIDVLEKELKPLDLSAPQYIVLINVGSGRVETPVDLCKKLQYDTGAMTRLLDRIEAKGYIRRTAHGGDRRCVVLEMTAAGRELYPRLLQIAVEMNKRALKGFSREEIDTLERTLQRIRLNLAPSPSLP